MIQLPTREAEETVLETYDTIERLLHPNGRLYDENTVASGTVETALRLLYMKGYNDAKLEQNDNKPTE